MGYISDLTSDTPLTLLDFPNELLLSILRDLDDTTLFHLSLLCLRLHILALPLIFKRHHVLQTQHDPSLYLSPGPGPDGASSHDVLLRSVHVATFVSSLTVLNCALMFYPKGLEVVLERVEGILGKLRKVECVTLELVGRKPWEWQPEPGPAIKDDASGDGVGRGRGKGEAEAWMTGLARVVGVGVEKPGLRLRVLGGEGWATHGRPFVHDIVTVVVVVQQQQGDSEGSQEENGLKSGLVNGFVKAARNWMMKWPTLVFQRGIFKAASLAGAAAVATLPCVEKTSRNPHATSTTTLAVTTSGQCDSNNNAQESNTNVKSKAAPGEPASLVTTVIQTRLKSTEILVPLPIHPRVESVEIHSPVMFHSPFYPGTIQMLNASPITSLSLAQLQLSHHDWTHILPSISIPALTSLAIGDSEIAFPDLQAFLGRHAGVRQLDLGSGAAIGRLVPGTSKELLPRLERVVGSPEYLVHFLGPVEACPRVVEVVVCSEGGIREVFYEFQRFEGVLECLVRRARAAAAASSLERGLAKRYSVMLMCLSECGLVEWLEDRFRAGDERNILRDLHLAELEVRMEFRMPERLALAFKKWFTMFGSVDNLVFPGL